MVNVDVGNGLSASITCISASNSSFTRSHVIDIMLFAYSIPFLANNAASTKAKVVNVTLQSPEINFDTVAYCNLIDGSYGKKYIGTSSNGVANRRSDNNGRQFTNSMISELFIADAADENAC
ncbi:MAG: hypothetical protein EZS28_030429 [Streblomastix strix]|uniref:Uncharacterized protein n=1 Tax=Streblomastix strix TaxID=222440 RepID=A0A5J4UW82_9EUKA|nr:MAG: hypothetical protein EZS28_030429 [Streblomastix strix]